MMRPELRAPSRAPDGWISYAKYSEGARLVLRFLWDWRGRKRLVNPSIATMAGMLRRTGRTIQRHLRELQAGGDVVRLYTGGRGKQCIYYLGNGARAEAERAPLWPAETRKGDLRLSRRSRRRKGDTAITLNALHSSSSERGLEIIEPERLPDAPTPALLPALSGDAPPTPPMGGPGGAEPATTAPSSPVPAAARSPGLTSPPAPPRGPSGQKRSRARAWEAWPSLWRSAWGVWRMAFVRRYGEQPGPDLKDPIAMSGMLTEAMFWARGDEHAALHYFAFGALRFLRSRWPLEHNRPGHVLWYLRRIRVWYGAPGPTWQIPDLSPRPPASEPTPAPPVQRAAKPLAPTLAETIARARAAVLPPRKD